MLTNATTFDAQEILALQKLAYQSEAAIYNDYAIPPLTQTQESMLSDLQEKTVLKLVVDGSLIGSVRGCIRNGTGYIGRLIVHPDFQGRGYGTQLLKAIEKSLDKAERYELFTGHKSERNLSLYEMLGYRRFRMEKINDSLAEVFLEKPAGR